MVEQFGDKLFLAGISPDKAPSGKGQRSGLASGLGFRVEFWAY